MEANSRTQLQAYALAALLEKMEVMCGKWFLVQAGCRERAGSVFQVLPPGCSGESLLQGAQSMMGFLMDASFFCQAWMHCGQAADHHFEPTVIAQGSQDVAEEAMG